MMFKFILIALILVMAFFIFQNMNSGKNALENVELGQIFLTENVFTKNIFFFDTQNFS